MDKRKVISVVIVLLLCLTIYKLNINKLNNKKVEEIKQSNKVNKKQFAMYIKDKGEYKEYTSSDTFPEGYVIDESMSKCYDVDEQEIEGVTFTGNGNSITVTSGKTAYCYIYLNKFFKGDGTTNNPYQINTIEDLVDLSDYANTGDERIQEKNFKLMRNLDFKDPGSYEDSNRKDYGNINEDDKSEELIKELASGTGFTPIGVGSYNGVTNRFNSNFDGGGYKISNIYVNTTNKHAGLFALVGKAGSTNTIKNLTLTGNITKNGSGHAGGFIASTSSTTLNLENLHNEATITNNGPTAYTGGIIGFANETVNVTNCSNKNNINAKHSSGGIIGYANGVANITECSNRGNITITDSNTSYSGGIVGVKNGTGDININSTINYGKVSGTSRLGGVIGSINDGSLVTNINNTHNYGEILLSKNSSDNHVGGLAGSIGRGKYIINGCSNHGTILTSDGDVTTYAYIRLGGLIGFELSRSYSVKSFIINSGNYGNIEVRYSNILVSGSLSDDNEFHLGGLIGQRYSNTDVLNSFNTGNIKSFILADSNFYNAIELGGIYTGSSYNGPYIVNNVYNSGEISSLGTSDKYAIASSINSASTNMYYKNISGLSPTSSTDVLEKIEAMAEANMKIGDANNTNGLLYKLNNNVKTLNTNGLASIDSDLNGYTLDEWVIDSTTGYPTLKGLLNK